MRGGPLALVLSSRLTIPHRENVSFLGNVKKNEMGGACSLQLVGRGVCMILVGKPEGKTPMGRPRRRWQRNIIKMDI
jgi:hypothetical protein